MDSVDQANKDNFALSNHPNLVPTNLPDVLSQGTVSQINNAMDTAAQATDTQLQNEGQYQNRANAQVPLLDLTNNADLSPQEQLANIMYNSSPQRAEDIDALMKTDKNIPNMIKNHGHVDNDEALNTISSPNLNHYYRDVYKVDTDIPGTNSFLRLEELYSMISGSLPENTNDFQMTGLFTNINEDTMAALYEIMYDKPMNEEDYRNYLMYGDPLYYQGQVDNDLTNDSVTGSNLADFNEVKPGVSYYEDRVVTKNYDDTWYRNRTNTPQTADHSPINPILSTKAPGYGYDEIDQVLQLGTGNTMPVQAATYFANLNIDKNYNVKVPHSDWADFAKDNYPYTFKVSYLGAHVLANIIAHITVTYDTLNAGSLITLINQTALSEDHPGVYLLCQKTLLELYSLNYAVTHPTYLQYLTGKDMKWLRANLQYLAEWSGHYWEYRDFVEIWQDLDISVGYMQPQLSMTIGSTDLHYSFGSYNDNQNNFAFHAGRYDDNR